MEPGTRVLITGATGFVGSHLADSLARRDVEIRALVRSTSDIRHLRELDIELVEGDIGDRRALVRAMEGVHVVFHLAALTRARSPADFHRVNAEGTRRVVEAAISRERPRLVYLSSLAAVGPARDGRPVGPDDPPHPLSAYGESKLAGERISLDAADRLDVVALRAPAVYGPRDRDLLFFFQAAKWGVLPVPTGPVRRLQMVHVSDLAQGLIRGGDATATGVYHIAEASSYRWREVLELVAQAVGRSGRAVPVPAGLLRLAGAATDLLARASGRAAIFGRDKVREILAPGWLCETERARHDLGFVARIPLAQGLAETAEWYRARGLI